MQALTNFFTSLVRGAIPTGGAPQQGAWQHDAPTPDFKVRWERAAVFFSSLPLETYFDKAALERMSVRELKALVAERGIQLNGVLEKSDIVNLMLNNVYSSSECCPICSESYVSGDDMLRVLPCSHRFHVECVDRWFLNPVDYSRAPSCPLCKTELPVPA